MKKKNISLAGLRKQIELDVLQIAENKELEKADIIMWMLGYMTYINNLEFELTGVAKRERYYYGVDLSGKLEIIKSLKRNENNRKGSKNNKRD